MRREEWIEILYKIVTPILERSALGVLRLEMPQLHEAHTDQYLEAISRVICGMAPWIELNGGDCDERGKRDYCYGLIIKTLDNITNKRSVDFINFNNSPQSLVDSAYLAQAFLRAPSIWRGVSEVTQGRILDALKSTRKYRPRDNNWLLFSSIIEAFLLSVDGGYDFKRLWYGVKLFDTLFYLGDGVYGDGLNFCVDYYNSYVIHPMLMDILRVCVDNKLHKADKFYRRELIRFKRYVEIQERTISPEGTYPILGRTHICRLGAFHAMAYGVYLNQIPSCVTISQLRGGCDILLKRFVECDANFLDDNFLSIGICGDQPEIAESYVSMGSAYHCCNFFVCLGLAPESSFWSCDGSAWSSLKAYSGHSISADCALRDMTLRDMLMRSLRLILHLVKLRFRIR